MPANPAQVVKHFYSLDADSKFRTILSNVKEQRKRNQTEEGQKLIGRLLHVRHFTASEGKLVADLVSLNTPKPQAKKSCGLKIMEHLLMLIIRHLIEKGLLHSCIKGLAKGKDRLDLKVYLASATDMSCDTK